jgi:hypothetical protein
LQGIVIKTSLALPGAGLENFAMEVAVNERITLYLSLPIDPNVPY